MTGIIKELTVEPIVPNADHSAKRGYFVKLVGALAGLVAATTDVPHGVILDGETVDGEDSVALCGGNTGVVLVKLGGIGTRGTLGQLRADGSVENDDGAGARVLPCLFLQSGVADELVQAILIRPKIIGNAVAFTSTNGTAAAAAANLAGLAAETEKVGDDVRALYLALQTAGYLA